MPQVDLETLMSACAGGSTDRKIACESSTPPQDDFPPESFWLSKDAEFDWFDRNAFYERNESAKGISNPNHPNPALNSSSQRYYKPSVIGLPKTQKTNYLEPGKNRKKKSKARLFPKRTGSMSKPGVQLAEPSSPKVSCMGRVRSKRKSRKPAKPVGNRSGGICKQFLSMFRSDRSSKPVGTNNEPEPVGLRVNIGGPVRTGEFAVEPEPPGLGAMKRFASGRRSSSSAADVADLEGLARCRG